MVPLVQGAVILSGMVAGTLTQRDGGSFIDAKKHLGGEVKGSTQSSPVCAGLISGRIVPLSRGAYFISLVKMLA